MENKDNSNDNSLPLNSQSQSQIDVYSIQNNSASFGTEDKYVMKGQYMKISNKPQQIDTDAIMKQFYNSQPQKKKKNQLQRKNSKKVPKITSNPSKYLDFPNIKNKWKAEIEQCIQGYKNYLKQQKQSYDSKHKENLLKLYRALIGGIFELRNCAQSSINDLTSNQKKIISQEADVGKWITLIVDQFDLSFKQAQKANKIDSWKRKWEILVKNCSDPNNLELRRKIIRKKIKPIDVISNDDTFLMSQQARLQQERRNKLILAEAQKNFQKPLQFQNESQKQPSQRQQSYSVDNSQNLKSNMGSATNLQKKLSLQRQRLKQDYKYYTGIQIYNNLKNRIEDLLSGTQPYKILMNDLNNRFKVQRGIPN